MDGVEFDIEETYGGGEPEGFTPLEQGNEKNAMFPNFGSPSLSYVLAILVLIAIVVLIIMTINDFGPFAGVIQDIRSRVA